jgi:S1-C subfamily serine protease
MQPKGRWFVVACGVGLLSVWGMACTSHGSAPSKVSNLPTPSTSASSGTAPELMAFRSRACIGEERITSLLEKGPFPNLSADASKQSGGKTHTTNPIDEHRAELSKQSFPVGPALSTKELYQRTAQATVVIEAGGALGTGVVISKNGMILTNYHVVRSGKQADFTYKVLITFGELQPDGTMERQKDGPKPPAGQEDNRPIKKYTGVVYKADPVRDMALIRIVDEFRKYPDVLPIAKNNPTALDQVVALGHAGIGLTWAAKSCQVARVGKLGEDLVRLIRGDCAEDSVEMHIAPEMKAKCEERRRRLKEIAKARNPSLMLQTNCSITHGDSGGPVVNQAGELVALNQLVGTDPRSAVNVAFHIHAAEIRGFLSDIPDAPAYVIPNPWCDGGLDPSMEDIDLDGTIDTLVTRQDHRIGTGTSLFFDLDQDNFAKDRKNKGKGKFLFDAEVAILFNKEGIFVYYDTDNKGRFDVMVQLNKSAVPRKAFRIHRTGVLVPLDNKQGIETFNTDFLKKYPASVVQRLQQIAKVFRFDVKNSDTVVSSEMIIPDPLWGGGRNGVFRDVDRNGIADVIEVRSKASAGMLIDADEDSLGRFSPTANPKDLINSRKIDAEMSIIRQGDRLWAMYDTNNDGTFDLALLSQPSIKGVAVVHEAWNLGPKGKHTPAPEHIGRFALRPSLTGIPRAFYIKRLLPIFLIASDEGAGSLPDPLRASGYSFREAKVARHSVIDGESRLFSTLLVDADASSKFALNASAAEVIKSKKFKADVAMVSSASDKWVFYDTKSNGTFDLVFYTHHFQQGTVEHAYRIVGKGKLKAEPKWVGGKMIRHTGIFQRPAVGKQLKKIASKLFSSTAIE